MSYLRNQNGIALIAVLLLLTSMTVMGLAVMMVATIEGQISGNDRVAKVSFYDAEAGTQAGLSWLGNIWTQSGALAPVNNIDQGTDPKATTDPLDKNNTGNGSLNAWGMNAAYNVFSVTEQIQASGTNVPSEFENMTRMPVDNPSNYSMTKSSPYGGDDSNVRVYFFAAQISGEGPRDSETNIVTEMHYIGEEIDNI